MLQEYKCLKCKTETKDKKGDLFICPNPDCGLKWEVTDSGEWIIHGNLNLAWSLKAIELPEKLTIRGDLNLMGVKQYQNDSLKTLNVWGNIFMNNANFQRLPKEKFEMKGVLYCSNTEFHKENKDYIQNEDNKEKDPFYTWSDIQEIIKVSNLRKKLPELEGLI